MEKWQVAEMALGKLHAPTGGDGVGADVLYEAEIAAYRAARHAIITVMEKYEAPHEVLCACDNGT